MRKVLNSVREQNSLEDFIANKQKYYKVLFLPMNKSLFSFAVLYIWLQLLQEKIIPICNLFLLHQKSGMKIIKSILNFF